MWDFLEFKRMTKLSFIDIDRKVLLNVRKDAICIVYTFKLLGLRLYHKLNTNALPIDVKAVIEEADTKVGFKKQ